MDKKAYSYNEVFEASLKYFDGDELAASTWIKKYCLADDEGNYYELTPNDMHRRMANEFARIEDSYEYKMNHDDKLKLSEYGYNRTPLTEEKIFDLFDKFKYTIPAGSVMSGLASGKPVSLSNCFVIDSPSDSIDSIFKVCNEHAQLSKRRGGCVEENTSVIVKDKGIIPIKNVEVGDYILSFNIESNKDEWKRVNDVYYTEVALEDQIEIVCSNGTILRTSKKHPLLINDADNGYEYANYNSGKLLNSINRRPTHKSFGDEIVKEYSSNENTEFTVSEMYYETPKYYKLTNKEIELINNFDYYSLHVFQEKGFSYDDEKEKVLNTHEINDVLLNKLLILGCFNENMYNEIMSRVNIVNIEEDNQVKRNYIDISVEDNNNYYAGEFGFINIHNCGYDISTLRPNGALVNNSANTSSGAVSFMDLFSQVTNTIGQCIEENQRVLTKKGLVKIKDINVGEKVWTKIGFVEVINKFNNGLKKCFKVITKYGYEIIATDNHVFLTVDENGIYEKELKDIKVGDNTILLHGVPNSITEYVPLINTFTKPLRNISNDKGVFGQMVHNQYKPIKTPNVLDEKLAYIIGYIDGNGYIERERTTSISCHSTFVEIQDKIVSYMKDIFDIEVTFKKKRNENCSKCLLLGIEGTNFLIENDLAKNKAEFVSIPKKIYESPSSVQLAYLSGLFDADGSASNPKKGGYSFTTISKNLSYEFKTLLMANGILCKSRHEVREQENWKDLYSFTIVGGYNQHKLVELFKESIKIQKANFISKRDCILTPYCRKNSGIINRNFVKVDDQFISQAKFINYEEYNGTMLAKDEIVDIIPLEHEMQVYDIQLAEENKFWCEGFYVHNCGRRSALMLSMSIVHPDSKEFIEKKQDLTKVTGANISVQITDEFMSLLENEDDTFIQKFPIDIDNSELFDTLDDLEYNVLYKGKKKNSYFKLIHAKELWKDLIHCAWNTAEPGILFQTRHHSYSPDGVYPSFRGTCSNPCVIGSTTLLTKEGYVTIESVVGKEIEIWNGKEWTTVKPFKTSDKAKVYKVKFTNNKELICTEYHKFILKGDVRKELKDCKVGDILEDFSNPYENSISNGIRISSIEYYGEEATYCVTDEKNHSALFNGIMTGQCGEIYMREDSCRLIHVNLSSFIKDEFTDNASIDYDKLYQYTYETMHLADDLVDLEKEALEKIMDKISEDGDKDGNEYKLYQRLLKHTLEGRRCGLGILGLSDAIAKLGFKLDSDESLNAINELMKTMFKAELDAQIDLAIERGRFQLFDVDSEKVGNEWYEFVKSNFSEQYNKMMKYGRRNVSFSTIAPTGTVGLMARTTGGIEPLFMPYYVRRRKCMNNSDRVDFVDVVGEKYTEFVVVHPTLMKWASVKYNKSIEDINNWNINKWDEIYKESPWFGSTAPEIDWIKRIEIQRIAQNYTSHSISSTINLPKETTEYEIATIYYESWKRKLKGVTIYRDGCRNGILVSTNDAKKEEKKKNMMCIDNSQVTKRPKSIPCKIFRFNNKGERWIGVIGLIENKPYEIFTGLQERLSIPNWVEDAFVVKNKERVNIDGEEKTQSRYDICYIDKNGEQTCVEGLSRTFNSEYWNYAKLISGLLRHHMPISYVIKVISSLNLDSSNINTWKNGVIRLLKKFNDSIEGEFEKCPECGGRIIRESGCLHCADCGYSRCE